MTQFCQSQKNVKIFVIKGVNADADSNSLAGELEKRKNDFLRFGKRKHEYLRFGKRKHEYLRFG